MCDEALKYSFLSTGSCGGARRTGAAVQFPLERGRSRKTALPRVVQAGRQDSLLLAVWVNDNEQQQ